MVGHQRVQGEPFVSDHRRRAAGFAVAACVAALVVSPGSVLAPTPAQAAACRPTPSLLTRASTVVPLLGGAAARVWDTGVTPSNPQASTRLVAVTVPRSSPAHARVLAASSLTAARTPSAYLSSAHTPVVMVNGGVFDASRGALPLLPQMVGGRVTKARYVHEAVITVGPDGTSSPDHLWLSGTATAAGHSVGLTGLNWQSVTGTGLNAYTPAWGPQRRPYGTVDVVVTGGRVTAVRAGSARGAAPRAGQTVLTATGTAGAWLARLRVGTAMTVSYRAETDARHPVRDAVGRGARYLLHGVVQGGACLTRDELLRPRTAVGWRANGDLVVVAVSGRALVNGVRYGGATIHQMADYLHQLGCVEATALDGGGSTTLLARRAGTGAVVRLDRSMAEAQRAVPNVLALG